MQDTTDYCIGSQLDNKVPSLLGHEIDTCITVDLLKSLPTKLVISEVGVFLGSWCISINSRLRDKEIKFLGIEDLTFINNRAQYEWYLEFDQTFKNIVNSGEFDNLLNSPSLPLLEKFIKDKSIEYTGVPIDIVLDQKLTASSDVIHHDCAIDGRSNDNLFKLYHELMHDQSILIVDNFGPEQPMRTVVLSKYICDQMFYVIGFGKRKAYLTKNLDFANRLTTAIKEYQEHAQLTCKLNFFYDKFLKKQIFFVLPDKSSLL